MPDSAPKDRSAQMNRVIHVTVLKEYWKNNAGNKQKYSVLFAIDARRNKIYESLLTNAKTFPASGKRTHVNPDARPFRLLKCCKLASWVLSPRRAALSFD